MFRIEQEATGLLITNPRGYRLFTTVFFGGRRRHDAALAAASGAAAGHRVLDIACGPGALVHALAERVGPGGEVLGVDAAPTMVEYARAHSRRSNCRFQYGVAQSLDLPDCAFDVVTCTFAMHHIPEGDRGAAVAEMWRVLRPGGSLLLADLANVGLHGLLTRLLSRHMDPESVDIRRYRDALVSNGFESVETALIRPATRVLTAVKPA
ncbi:class I SAM-dependent methyltransferase [Mycobacterium sp. CBMA226]|nr:class I SAM-dependent methyltransferase [Mycolicibacterium sp. CBMA 226]